MKKSNLRKVIKKEILIIKESKEIPPEDILESLVDICDDLVGLQGLLSDKKNSESFDSIADISKFLQKAASLASKAKVIMKKNIADKENF